MTQEPPPSEVPRELVTALYALSVTLTSRDRVAVGLAVTGSPGALRTALDTLAGAWPDLVYDRRISEVCTIVACLTPHLTPRQRAGLWRRLCDAVAMEREWAMDGAADLYLEEGLDGDAAVVAEDIARSKWEAQHEEMLRLLTGGEAGQPAVAA